MAVGYSVGPARWEAEADRLLERMAGRFARVETRRRTRGFLLGLLADLPRKNCWSIAEHAGDRDPAGGLRWKRRYATRPRVGARLRDSKQSRLPLDE